MVGYPPERPHPRNQSVPPPLSAATRVVDNSEQGGNNVGGVDADLGVNIASTDHMRKDLVYTEACWLGLVEMVTDKAVVQALFVIQDKTSSVSLEGRGKDELLHADLTTCNTAPRLRRAGAAF
jgi:hypothetical protein